MFKTLSHFDSWQQMSMLSVCSELNANISPGWPPTQLALALAMKQNNPSAQLKDPFCKTQSRHPGHHPISSRIYRRYCAQRFMLLNHQPLNSRLVQKITLLSPPYCYCPTRGRRQQEEKRKAAGRPSSSSPSSLLGTSVLVVG